MSERPRGSSLIDALEGARPAIEAALKEAEAELAALVARKRDLETLIASSAGGPR